MFNLIRKKNKQDGLSQYKKWESPMEKFFESGLFNMPAGFFEDSIFPKVDISETKKEVIVKAEIPGVDTKDIDLTINGRVLTIKGEKKQEKEEKDGSRHLIERSYGYFHRSMELPTDVDENKVDASYKKGILNIVLTKLKESETKKISVKNS